MVQTPDEMQKHVSNFSRLMLSKLAANRFKGSWEKRNIKWLLSRLREEVNELGEAINNSEHFGQIWSECADVANFAMMISENYEAKDE